jgi:hypothetical protein
MAYDKRRFWQHSATAIALNGTPAAQTFVAPSRIKVHEVGGIMTVVMNSAAAFPAWGITKTINGSAGAAGGGGALTFSKTQAVGTGVFDTTSTIFPYVLNAGDILTFDDTVAATTSGSAIFYVKYELMEEIAANRTTYLAESA